ncbi:uncharacterized protein KY384_000609 [Bacidia gigantensis]|uniref:uncharacterized protein n=1 Tax=Bacidia gigantensis TaxID=2732470 RepID=UPI001D03EFC7|nr:uncharacterized protein KY384_000609 [Bacidia gigantensis]KAG8525849.1 hypothetical protein KY384_000609 [Bacidia gigantensis]
MEQQSLSTYPASGKQYLEKKESPLRRYESLKRPAGYSKPEEIMDLWSLANGQAAELAVGVYSLELSCDDLSLNSEIITFSTSTSTIYALAAAKSSQISSTRIHPLDTRTRIPVCSTVLNRPSRQDPLIASIFPKAAGLMALDQSSNMAIEKGLDRQASALLQAEAIKNAQEKEASMLLWDCDSGRFCLLHPTLLDDMATTMRIEITPSPTAPQQITIFAPETNTPLLELEMSALALKIHVETIKSLPSLYILDTLVTSMLTLLLHLHRLCADPSNRHSPQQAHRPEDDPLYFPPPPPSLHSTASRRDLRRQRADSRHSAFRSVRSVKSSRSLASGYEKDIELGVLDPETARMSKDELKLQKKKAPKGVIDVDDPALPKGTRAALRFMYWVFEVVYWILGALVQFVALGVVAMGKFVQKL